MEYINHIDSVESTMRTINSFVTKTTILSPLDKRIVKTSMVQAASLLNMHKEEGRNFMYSKD